MGFGDNPTFGGSNMVGGPNSVPDFLKEPKIEQPAGKIEGKPDWAPNWNDVEEG